MDELYESDVEEGDLQDYEGEDARVEGLKNVIDAFASSAIGSGGEESELSRRRALLLDAYQGKNIEPAPEGQSQVVDWTIYETVQWILPSLLRIFAGGDDVVAFTPVGEEDEEAADQESDYLNYLVTAKNNWFLTCLEWFQDALVTENAYAMATMDERIETETETYKGQSEQQLTMLLDDDVEVIGQNSYPDPDHKPAPVQDPQTGQPVVDPMTGQPQMSQPQTLYDVQLRRTKARKTLRLDVLPPERCLIDENTPDFTVRDADYFEYWDNVTISDLRRKGYDVEDDVGEDADFDTLEDTARDEDGNEYGSSARNIPDPSMRLVKCRWIWVRHDYDGDGIAEMMEVVRVGQDILKADHCSRIPVACIVPAINTHRHQGTSVAGLVFDIGRIKTQLLRSGLDSLYLSVHPRHAISADVNMDDMLVSRPGGLVRMNNGAIPGQGHVIPLPTEFVFPHAQAGLQHMDTVVESRAGVNRMFQGIDESAVNDHNRIGQLSTMAAQRVELIARLFANGVEELFKIAHELVIKSGYQAEAVKLRGKWVTVDPKQWRTGRDMSVVAPFAAGNKDSLIQRLMIIGQIHEKALAGGLPIVDLTNAYNLALELTKAADLPGHKFFTDPRSIKPAPPKPDPVMEALKVEQGKVQVDASKVKASSVDAERKAELEKYKIDVDAQVSELVARINADTQVTVARIRDGQAVNLENIKAAHTKDIKRFEAQVRNQPIAATEDAVAMLTNEVAAAIERMTEAMRGIQDPKEVVRGPDGKVVGVRTVRPPQ